MILLLFSSLAFGGSAPGGTLGFKKVLLILLENGDYSDALSQPYLRDLAQSGALLTNFSAITHPSYPNYLALTAGTTFGRSNDTVVEIKGRHIGDLLEEAGKTWKNYVEGHPGGCPLKGTGVFAPKHIPFLSYSDVRNPVERCLSHVVDSKEFFTDVQNGTLPDYSFYTPDLNNDGHDSSVEFASGALQSTFGHVFTNQSVMKDLLVVVTFDEDDSGIFGHNHIFTALYGASILPGTKSGQKLNHYDLLKTIEAGLGVGDLGQGDAHGTLISGVWKTQSP